MKTSDVSVARKEYGTYSLSDTRRNGCASCQPYKSFFNLKNMLFLKSFVGNFLRSLTAENKHGSLTDEISMHLSLSVVAALRRAITFRQLPH